MDYFDDDQFDDDDDQFDDDAYDDDYADEYLDNEDDEQDDDDFGEEEDDEQSDEDDYQDDGEGDGYGEDIGDGYGEDLNEDKEKKNNAKKDKDKEDDLQLEGEKKGKKKKVSGRELEAKAKKMASRYGIKPEPMSFACPDCKEKTLFVEKRPKTFLRRVASCSFGFPTEQNVKRYVCLNPNCKSYWPIKGFTFTRSVEGKLKKHTIMARFFHTPK